MAHSSLEGKSALFEFKSPMKDSSPLKPTHLKAGLRLSRLDLDISPIDERTLAMSQSLLTLVFILLSSRYSPSESCFAAYSRLSFSLHTRKREINYSQRVPKDLTDLYYPVSVVDPSKYFLVSGINQPYLVLVCSWTLDSISSMEILIWSIPRHWYRFLAFLIRTFSDSSILIISQIRLHSTPSSLVHWSRAIMYGASFQEYSLKNLLLSSPKLLSFQVQETSSWDSFKLDPVDTLRILA